jgi:hypothetical protein
MRRKGQWAAAVHMPMMLQILRYLPDAVMTPTLSEACEAAADTIARGAVGLQARLHKRGPSAYIDLRTL